MNLKRNNWSNEEVINILKGLQIDNPKVDKSIIYNQGLGMAMVRFGDFAANPETSYSAMGYDTETGEILHIGRILPQ